MQRFWIIALAAGVLAVLAPEGRASAERGATGRALAERGPARLAFGGDGFEVERSGLAKELIAGLEAHAEWCTSKKIWIERNRALEAILVVDPGNLPAKRGLGWLQVADGVWEPPKDPKPAKNFDPGAVKEAPKRLAEAIRPWRDHLIGLLDTYKSELTPTQRDSVYEQILAVNADDDFVRGARGEAKSDKGWVLGETVRAKVRRGEIKAIVKRALAEAPAAKDFVPSANDLVFKVDWKNAVGTEHVRVLSTGDRAEAMRVAQVLHAQREVFRGVFDTTTDLGAALTIYLLCDKASRETFLANLPGTSAAQRALYEQMDGTGLPGSNSGAWWSPTPDRRLDGTTRHAFGAMFQEAFNLTTDVAWAWEGLGLYLTREMIGSRLTWYIVPVTDQTVATKKVAQDWMNKLLTPGTNWMNEGWQLVRRGGASSVIGTLNRPVNKMTPQDLFIAYVVAAYLLESRAAELPGMLRMLGGGKGKPPKKPAQAWQDALSMDLSLFSARLERWLGERR